VNTTLPFSEQDFYQRQTGAIRPRLLALSAALVLHLAAAAAAVYGPGFFRPAPLLEDVMTVDLVSLPEPEAAAPEPEPSREPPAPPVRPEPPQPKPDPVAKPEPRVEPEVAVKPEPVAEPEPAVSPEPAKPVSLRPRKRKIRKAADTRLAEEKARQREQARQREEARRKRLARQRALARARQEERRAAEAARKARAELAAIIREQASLGGNIGRSRGKRQVSSALEKQYYMNLADRVQRLWVVPAIKRWPANLETLVEFTVLRDGRLVNLQVARSSGDAFFDRFARETIRKAAPMPPIPAALKKERIDFGLRLRPAGVQH